MSTFYISLGLAFIAGVLTLLSPCILPILPIIMGRSLQSHDYAPIALVLGLASGFALAGSLLGVTAGWLTHLIGSLRTGAIALLLVLGIFALLPKWRDRLLSCLPRRVKREKPVPANLVGEFWLGAQLGLLWTPCAGSVLGSILVLAAVDREVIGAFILLLSYGIGAAVPMLAFAYGGRYFSRQCLQLRPYSVRLQQVGGVLIVSTAIAILLGWDVQIQLWLAPFFPSLSLSLL